MSRIAAVLHARLRRLVNGTGADAAIRAGFDQLGTGVDSIGPEYAVLTGHDGHWCTRETYPSLEAAQAAVADVPPGWTSVVVERCVIRTEWTEATT